VVCVQHLARAIDVVVVIGTKVPRQLEHRVQPRADPARLGALFARALEPSDLAHCGLEDLLGQLGGLHAGAIVISTVRLAFAELLADRGKLLAQQNSR